MESGTLRTASARRPFSCFPEFLIHSFSSEYGRRSTFCTASKSRPVFVYPKAAGKFFAKITLDKLCSGRYSCLAFESHGSWFATSEGFVGLWFHLASSPFLAAGAGNYRHPLTLNCGGLRLIAVNCANFFSIIARKRSGWRVLGEGCGGFISCKVEAGAPCGPARKVGRVCPSLSPRRHFFIPWSPDAGRGCHPANGGAGLQSRALLPRALS
jgi:hypothetical protein